MKFASVVPLCLGWALLASLPVLAGPTYLVYSAPAGGAGSTVVSGVNNAGDYVGWCLNSNYYVGFSHDQSGYSAVGPADSAGGPGTHPEQINDSSQIVGYYQNSSGLFRGFIDNGGTYTSLDAPGSLSTLIYGNNNSGLAVGTYQDGSGATHGFSYTSSGGFSTIDVAGAVATYVYGVDDAGDVVGSYFDGTNTHAFFMAAGGAPTTIDVPGSTDTVVRDINNLGQIVGWYDTCAGCPQIGFLLQGGNYTSISLDPNASTYLVGINDNSQVLVDLLGPMLIGGTYLGSDVGLLMGVGGPEPPNPPAVPEPATGLLMAAGGAALIALGRFHRPSWRRSQVSGK